MGLEVVFEWRDTHKHIQGTLGRVRVCWCVWVSRVVLTRPAPPQPPPMPPLKRLRKRAAVVDSDSDSDDTATAAANDDDHDHDDGDDADFVQANTVVLVSSSEDDETDVDEGTSPPCVARAKPDHARKAGSSAISAKSEKKVESKATSNKRPRGKPEPLRKTKQSVLSLTASTSGSSAPDFDFEPPPRKIVPPQEQVGVVCLQCFTAQIPLVRVNPVAIVFWTVVARAVVD